MSTTYFSLASGNFSQFWTDIGLIAGDDNWDGVPSIVGYRGDGLVTTTGRDPTTVFGSSDVVDVNANRSDPSVFATGGLAEFDGIADPVVALQGSGTADAPYLVLHLDATGRENITFSVRLRDIDTASTATQPIAIQYRIGETGDWQNVAGGSVANANVGADTLLSVTLPAAANGEAQLQIRVITTDAVGSDAFIGIDDIQVTSDAIDVEQPGILSIADASVAEGDAGSTALTFTVSRDGGAAGAVSATWTITFPANAEVDDLAAGQALTGTVSFADGQDSVTITIQVAGDTDFEPTETFAVTLSAPAGGATLGDPAATGTITNDDDMPATGGIFINEIHYDNVGVDAGERIEIAAPAGTNLAGWTLVLYNGSNGDPYRTTNLSGIVPDQDDGFGTISFTYPTDGIQNGSPDGIALVDPDGNVVQFLSYEGVMTADSGPAAGLTSTDIGVAEGSSSPLGFSLQLTGAGATYEDFTWAQAGDDNFGAVNTGQDFIGPNATGLVTIGDMSIVEGDDGVQMLVFTIRRAGGLGQEASVDWLLATGSAGTDDLGPGQPLGGSVEFGLGVASVQISIAIQGDTLGEGNESFEILLANPVGNIAITDGAATGTILNDDPIALAIYEIQGEAHRSPYEGQPVITQGVVTVVAANGFYLQDAAGDGNAATSDAIFVFTGATPAVAVGDAVEVTGSVGEFLPGGDATNLTVTQIATTSAPVVLSSGNGLAALVIGTGGVLPPTSVIDDDGLTIFDPANDGIDFWESLEGMYVTIDSPLAIANTNEFGETYVVASGGAGATGVSARGGLTLSDGDYNPERIQIDDSSLFPGYDPDHSQGDLLSDVTGIISYSFNSYELLVTEAVTTVVDVTLGRETTTLAGDSDHLTVASYNVENLSPTDTAMKFDLLAGDIVYSLGAPDIIALQEIQDGNGLNGSDPLSGIVTAQLLIDAIAAIGGPNYVYVEIAPSANNSTGGEPNGNIRNGYLYNPDRVTYVEGSAQLIEDPAFLGSRRPLVADFVFNGQLISLINVHFTSRIGSDPLWGADQPPEDAGDAARTAQAEAVRAYVNDALATDPDLMLGVLGDYNGFWFEDAVATLEAGGVMTDLHRLLAEAERYTYRFDGNLQAIDHLVATGELAAVAEFDAVHLNAEQIFGAPRGTDHDPIIARFSIEQLGDVEVTVGTAGDDDLAGGNGVDRILAHDGDDVLAGGNGADQLLGGDGSDVLIGGRGDDRLEGGGDADLFVFGKNGGIDEVLDYQSGDQLLLVDGIGVKSARTGDFNGDGVGDLLIAFTGAAGAVILYGVDNLAAVDFAGPEDLSNYPAF